jgi:prolipoprotein diacylglyceryltransferase
MAMILVSSSRAKYSYAVNDSSKITVAAPGQFEQTAAAHSTYFLTERHKTIEEVPRKNFKRPSALGFLPIWFFAYDYPNNVNEEGIPLANCANPDKKYCNHLPVPVFPTPLYEMITCLILFAILWGVRKRLKIPGTLFALYLMFNGVERFFVEKIRVNTQLSFFGFHPTQAEVISALLFLTGLILWIVLKRNTKKKSTSQELV